VALTLCGTRDSATVLAETGSHPSDSTATISEYFRFNSIK